MQKLNKAEICTTITTFQATEAHHLPLEEGDLVEVLQKDSETWWSGRKVIGKQSGVFPAAHVKAIKGKVDATLAGFGVETKTFRNVKQQEVVNDTGNATKIAKFLPEQVLAIDRHKAERDDELNVELNDIVQVIERKYPKWWFGCNERTGATGFFPVRIAQIIESVQLNDNQQVQLLVQRESRKSEKQNVSIDESDSENSDSNESTGNSSSESSLRSSQLYIIDNYKHSQQPKVRSQQRFLIICELIETEQKYIEKLHFTSQNFLGPLQRSNLMSIEEIDTVFDHLQQIYEVNISLYDQLNNRFRREEDNSDSCIGALLTSHLQSMLPVYRDYCSSNMAQLLTKIDDNQQFGAELDEIAIRQQSYQTFKSFALMPMQRITKYPLLIDKILEYTPPEHTDHEDCKAALNGSKSLCEEINKIFDKACIEYEPFKKLFWIQKHIILPYKQVDQAIDFNSETLFLGPRTLLNAGILFSNSKMLFAFLFNDFFLLAIPEKGSCFSGMKREQIPEFVNVFDHAQTRKVKCTLYKKPFILDDITIIELDESEAVNSPNSFKLETFSLKRNILLRTNSYNEWTTWLEQLNKAKEAYCKAQNIFERIDTVAKPLDQTPIAMLNLINLEAVQLYTRNYALNAYCNVAIGKNWSTAHSTITTKTFRRVMDFRHASSPATRNKSILSSISKLATGRPLSDEIIDNPHRIFWETEAQLNVHSLQDLLLVRCYDSSSFAPHQFLGEASIPIGDLIDQRKSGSSGLSTKGVPLHLPQEVPSANFLSKLNIKPCLLVKFELITNSETVSE